MTEILELGTFEETRNGVPLKFKVMTVPKEIVDDVVDHMATYYLNREPLATHVKLLSDPVAVKAVKEIWKEKLEGGVSLVAIREGAGPLKDRIVGANVTYIAHKDDVDDVPEEGWGKLKEVYLAGTEAIERAKIYEKYHVDKFLSAFGLSVHPHYHGYHIGERLLQCREPLCRHLGLKVTGTIFSAETSMYLAKKIGFKVEYEEDYSNYRHKGKLLFDGLPGKFEYSVLKYNH